MTQTTNKTQPTDADVAGFLATLDEPQRRDSQQLIDLMSQVSQQPAILWGTSIIGFGSYHYVYASGREGDTPVIAFAPRKGKLTLYFTEAVEQYQHLLDQLGPYQTGKGCLYLKTLASVDRATLTTLLETAYRDRTPA